MNKEIACGMLWPPTKPMDFQYVGHTDETNYKTELTSTCLAVCSIVYFRDDVARYYHCLTL